MSTRLLALVAGLTLVLAGLVAPSTAHAASWNSNYVALGDSYASGTGLADAAGACLTSSGAFPHQLNKKVDSLACSGASSADLAGQIAAAKQLSPAKSLNGQRVLFRAQQVSLTLGANDLGWTQALLGCLANPLACETLLGGVVANLNGQEVRTANSIAAVRQEAPKAKIFVTGYPRPFDPAGPACVVGNLGGTDIVLPAAQAALMDSIIASLNARIAQGVALSGDRNVVFVDVAAEFSGHGLCRGADAWVNGIVPSGALTRTLHLNSAGEQAYARVLRAALK
ncbi:SGNH/GDSL hydrolase family protein [Aestuariimicrobium sp. Y1814]|uniref:SGNH/GDSL hydrolase family protein n=1 Tax=Aestuariimicrobium sp. Y1814 TaxID=3418742 RepID=UPI003DA76C57